MSPSGSLATARFRTWSWTSTKLPAKIAPSPLSTSTSVSMVRVRGVSWRRARLSAGEIAQVLSDENVESSVRTVERVLAEEGFPRLPRRTRLRIGLTEQ